jgi:hypothetical protein
MLESLNLPIETLAKMVAIELASSASSVCNMQHTMLSLGSDDRNGNHPRTTRQIKYNIGFNYLSNVNIRYWNMMLCPMDVLRVTPESLPWFTLQYL